MPARLTEPAPSKIARLVAPRTFELASQTVSDPPPGSVRVKVLACGVCASELHAVDETLDAYPVTMGHEPLGLIDAVGEGVRSLAEGTRVTGGFGPSFAEYVVTDHRNVVVVPEELSTEESIGEPLGCVVEGRRRTPVVAGDRVALVGAGYMGLLMLQVLRVTGAGEVVVIEPREPARAAAATFGATETLEPGELSDDLNERFDVAFEATGTQAGLDLVGGLVREHGILSILGYHQAQRTVDMQMWNWKAIDVVNAHVRRRDYLNEAIRRGLELVRLGRIHPEKLITHRFGLDEVGEAFEALISKPDGYIKSIVTPIEGSENGREP
jgi:2-desacetyl-2-hydroxyethyl bacteriochlorophyllide A dehydrogenase